MGGGCFSKRWAVADSVQIAKLIQLPGRITIYLIEIGS